MQQIQRIGSTLVVIALTTATIGGAHESAYHAPPAGAWSSTASTVQSALDRAGLGAIAAVGDGDVIVLRGGSLTRAQASRALAIAASVPGVRVVRDEMGTYDSTSGVVTGTAYDDGAVVERARDALQTMGVVGAGTRVHVNGGSSYEDNDAYLANTEPGLAYRVAEALAATGIPRVGRDVRVYNEKVLEEVRTPVYGSSQLYASGTGMQPIVSGLAKSGPTSTPRAPRLPANDITRVGGANALCPDGVHSVAGLADTSRSLEGVYRDLLAQAGWAGDPADLFNALRNGPVRDTTYPVGATLQWMGLQRHGKPGLVKDARWAGKEPLAVYEVTFDSRGWRYTFAVAKECCNLALVGGDLLAPRPTAQLRATSPDSCVGTTITIDAVGSRVVNGELLELIVEERDPNGTVTELSMPGDGSRRLERPTAMTGEYRYRAFAVARGGARSGPATAKVTIRACPPSCSLDVSAPEILSGESVVVAADGAATHGTIAAIELSLQGVGDDRELQLVAPFNETIRFDGAGNHEILATALDSYGQRSESCTATVRVLSRVGPFIGAYTGTERRWRGGDVDGDRSAPLIAPYVGVGYMLSRNVELAAVGGGAINTRDNDHSSLFADLELNYLGRKYFIGGGVGLWDFNHEEARTASLLVHGGVDLPWRVNDEPTQFMVQGRLLTDYGFDHPDNNYVLWGGVRVPLTRNRVLAQPFDSQP